MRIENKITKAERLLRKLLPLLKTEFKRNKNLTAVVENYQEGREQGKALSVTTSIERTNHLWVAFAECVRTDQIAVYWSFNSSFDGIGKRSFMNATYFNRKPLMYIKAAHFIIGLVRKVAI